MKIVYLAGPISGLDYNGCNDWRKKAIEQLAKEGIKGISPMRYKEYLSKEEVIIDDYINSTWLNEVNICLSGAKGLTVRDRFDTMGCNLFLANLLGAKKISIGTMIEYGWADASRKPIITVIEKEGNPHDHSMVRELTGFRVETLEEGLYIAKAILN